MEQTLGEDYGYSIWQQYYLWIWSAGRAQTRRRLLCSRPASTVSPLRALTSAHRRGFRSLLLSTNCHDSGERCCFGSGVTASLSQSTLVGTNQDGKNKVNVSRVGSGCQQEHHGWWGDGRGEPQDEPVTCPGKGSVSTHSAKCAKLHYFMAAFISLCTSRRLQMFNQPSRVWPHLCQCLVDVVPSDNSVSVTPKVISWLEPLLGLCFIKMRLRTNYRIWSHW